MGIRQNRSITVFVIKHAAIMEFLIVISYIALHNAFFILFVLSFLKYTLDTFHRFENKICMNAHIQFT